MPELLERLQQALADRYTVERELGAGGMATVYLAEDLRHHRKVALKLLKPELAAVLGAERFLKEIEVTASLQHPHILPLFDSGDASGLLFYVMPYVAGESLRSRLEREKQLPLDDALQVTREVADALDYAHSHGVIHRDIKPENILLQGGHAVVADFGIARAVSSAGGTRLTETGLAIGTPAYMSPEQASGERDLDGRSDLYSLACMLYEMLIGETPYTGPTPMAILARKLSEPLPRVSVVRETVPAGVEAALAKALARTPADRFATAADFAAALAKPETMRSVASPSPPTWWQRRTLRRAAFALVALAALTIVAAGVYELRSGRSSVDRMMVVVAPFENHIRDTALAALAAIASDWTTQVLQATGDLKVVPAVEVAAAHWTPGNKVQDLAVATGGGTVVTGSASLQGDSVLLRADLVDGSSGRLLTSVQPVVGVRQRPLEAVRELARRATAATGTILRPGVLGQGLEFARMPASFEAYREFTEGQRESAEGHNAQAAQRFQRAYAMDTTFLFALMGAVGCHYNSGDFSGADSLVRFIEVRRDRLTAVQQLQADGSRAMLSGDWERQVALSRELVPRSPTGPNIVNWGWAALSANRPAEAIHVLAEVARDDAFARTWPFQWVYLADAYHARERHREELRVAQRARKLYPTSLLVLGSELRARAALGQERDVGRLLDEARAMQRDPWLELEVGGGQGYLQPYDAALEYRAHGHVEAYRRAVSRAIDATSLNDTTVAGRWSRALVLYTGERWTEAAAAYASLAAAHPDSVALIGGLAVSEARRSHRAVVDSLVRRLVRLDRPYTYGRSQYWRARVSAVLGDRDGAVTLLRQALAAGFVCTYHEAPVAEACHREMDFESLRGYPPFDELLRPKG